MIFEEFKTERLILRKITPEVYDFIFGNYSDDALKKFLALKSDEELFIEKERQEKGHSMYMKTLLYFQLIDPKTKKNIGACGFHTWYLPHRRAELFYFFSNDSYKAQGLMSEAMEFVLKYGFEKLNLNRVEAFVSKQNEASLKIMKRFDFVNEGILKEHYCKDNTLEDSMIFGLLRKDFLMKTNDVFKG